MLRIDVEQRQQTANFVLAGKLVGPWVTELENCWQAVIANTGCRPDVPSTPIVVDLSKVTFIDEPGKQLIIQMCQHGVRLIGTGLIAEFICKELKAAARKCQPLVPEDDTNK